MEEKAKSDSGLGHVRVFAFGYFQMLLVLDGQCNKALAASSVYGIPPTWTFSPLALESDVKTDRSDDWSSE